MALIGYEIQKFFKQKMVFFILLGLLLINLAATYVSMVVPIEDNTNVTRLEISDFYCHNKNKSNQDMLHEIEERLQGELSPDEREILMYLKEEISYVDSYATRIEEIQKEQERLSESSFFQNEKSFSRRNIDKSAAQYKKFENFELQASQVYDILAVTDVKFTRILLLVIAILVALKIAMVERENGMIGLIHTLKYGESQLIIVKWLALIILLFVFVFIFFGGNYLIGIRLFGVGSWGRPLQGMSGYMLSPYLISVGHYLVIYIIFVFMGLVTIATVIFFACIILKSNILSCVVMLPVLIVEWLLYQGIDNQSYFAIFRLFNLMAGLDVAKLFQNFNTVNMAGYPLSSILLVVCFEIGATGLSVFGSMCAWRKSARVRLCVKRKPWRSKINKNDGLHMWAYECYKLFVCNKGFWILGIFLGIQIIIAMNVMIRPTEIEKYYQYYSRALEGELTQKKLLELERIKNKSDQEEKLRSQYWAQADAGEISYSYAQYKINELMMNSEEKAGFDKAYNQYMWLQGQKERGKDVSYISTLSYHYLLENDKMNLWNTVGMLVVIILGMCNFISYEKHTNMYPLICSVEKGKKNMYRNKIKSMLLYVGGAYGIAFLPYILQIGSQMPFEHLMSSSPSLIWFGFFPDWILVWCALGLIQVLKFLGGCVTAVIIMFFSKKIYHVSVTIVLGVMVFVLPLIIFSGMI